MALTRAAKLTSKGQVTLPVEIRRALGVSDGDRIEFFVHRDGRVSVQRRNVPADAVFGRGASYAERARRSEPMQSVTEAIAEKGKQGKSRKAG